MENDAQVLISPLHHAPCGVDRLRTWFGGTKDPRQIVVPLRELLIEVGSILGSKHWRNGERVLNLRGDFAELDVLDHRDYTNELPNDILLHVSDVLTFSHVVTYRILATLGRTYGNTMSPPTH